MASGTPDDPIEIDISFSKSVGRHFWNVVSHPLTTPRLYPNLNQFLEEITPVLMANAEKYGDDFCFVFSTDTVYRVFQLRYDAKTGTYYIKRVRPFTPDAAMTELPKPRPTALDYLEGKLGITNAKRRFKQFMKDNNPFPMLQRSSSDE